MTRLGYLFFGAPNERSTAVPPRDFYIYFTAPYDPPHYKEEKKADELFFQLTGMDDAFRTPLQKYAAALDLASISSGHAKKAYQDKATAFLRDLVKWLQEHMSTAFEVVYQGKSKELTKWIEGKNLRDRVHLSSQERINFRDMVNGVSGICLAGYFAEKSPHYPTFSVLVTRTNREQAVRDALRTIAGETKTKQGIAILDALELLDGDRIEVPRSQYARYILDVLKGKKQGQVVNRNELIQDECGVEYLASDSLRLEPEWTVVLLAALVYSGDIVLSVPGQKLDASNLSEMASLELKELVNFKHIERPKDWDLPALKSLFEMLGLPPGLAQMITQGKAEPVQQLQDTVAQYLKRVVVATHNLQSGMNLWGQNIFSEAEVKKHRGRLELIKKIEESEIPYWFPTDRMPKGYNTEQPKMSHGITHVHHFYTKRNLWVLAILRKFLSKSFLEGQLLCLVGDQLPRASKMHKIAISRINTSLSKTAGVLAGTLYVPSNQIEYSIVEMLGFRIQDVLSYQQQRDRKTRQMCETVSSNFLGMLSFSVDYIFTDPPFGSNLMYSELNFLWEAWLKVFTNNKSEAIENKTQGKGLPEYQKLMAQCFGEYYRVLKPGHWMTVEFHNSENRVWNAIQEALQQAGFVVADVRTLDKKQGTFKQVAGGGAVKQDLIISAYKPNGGLEQRFDLTKGTEEGVWDFVRTHLKQLPVFVASHGKVEIIAERQNYLLFDRMVAFHVQRGVMVPMSAAEFYAGLAQKFPERDNMYFLPEQAAEYDKKRMKVAGVLQVQLFVLDEASAIQWLAAMLKEKPQTFQDIHPQFMKEIGGWKKHEKSLELKDLLEENFLCYDGLSEVPSQIHGYLSSNFQNLRNLAKGHPDLKAKARDRWYVPDPNKASDLEKLRDKSLLKEFAQYLEQAQSQPLKKLKLFRMEAVRAGFKKAWQEKDYQTIIAVAKKIPETILQEDPKLLMWYTLAITRVGGE